MNELCEPPVEVSQETKHPNQELIDDLRSFCNWLETHPQPKLYGASQFDQFVHSPEELAEMARGAGRVEKKKTGQWYYLVKSFGSTVKLHFNCEESKICERIVTGKRTVKKPIMKQVGTEEVEEEIVEWKCPKSLLLL
jgi:hypothetical protein